MAKTPKPIEIRPAAGGRLMAGLSAEAPGLANYEIKRDWRRYYDREIRAEGHEGLVLSQDFSTAIQTTPSGSATKLSLIGQARRGDGKRVIVAGNQTTLWACTATEDTHYAGTDYFAEDYVDETQYGWIQIATGLSESGQRWEFVQCGDYLVLNNGVDLPLTYRPGDLTAKPIYELREQGVASVGTIAVHNGILACMDVWILKDDAFDALMAPTGDASAFTPNPLQYAAFTDATQMQRFPWRYLPSMQGNPRRFGSIVPVAASLGDRTLTFKYPIRSLPELVQYNQSGGYSTTQLIGGATDIAVLYANVGGSTLTTAVVACDPDVTMSCRIADSVQNPIYATGDLVASIEASDAANSYAGTFVDLVDEGGAIIKALQLLDKVIVYKDTPHLYIGTFTGDLTNPYQFERVVIANESEALKHRNTLIGSGGGFYGSCHVYAGQSAFYKFDLYMRTPQEIPELQPAQDLFFSQVTDSENSFCAENPLTREWVWGWVGSGDDRALCFDYAFRTCRTTSADICAAAPVQHPTRGDWMFLFGTSDGTVQRYGLWKAPIESPTATVSVNAGQATASTAFFTVDHVGKTILLATEDLVAITAYISPTKVSVIGTAPNTTGAVACSILPGIWHRNGQGYDSILESGCGDLGIADAEKLITAYVPVASSRSPNALLTVDFKAGVNPESAAFVQSASVTAPQAHNLIQPTFMGYFVGVRIKVSGLNSPFELVNQIWHPNVISSRSAGRL